MNSRYRTTFRFTLPPASRTPAGFWMPTPRGCTVDVSETGDVLVASIDGSETYARNQVLNVAALFLRGVAAHIEPQLLHGTLAAPSCRERPEIYSISLGTAVTIFRDDQRRPIVTLGPEQLDLLNQNVG